MHGGGDGGAAAAGTGPVGEAGLEVGVLGDVDVGGRCAADETGEGQRARGEDGHGGSEERAAVPSSAVDRQARCGGTFHLLPPWGSRGWRGTARGCRGRTRGCRGVESRNGGHRWAIKLVQTNQVVKTSGSEPSQTASGGRGSGRSRGPRRLAPEGELGTAPEGVRTAIPSGPTGPADRADWCRSVPIALGPGAPIRAQSSHWAHQERSGLPCECAPTPLTCIKTDEDHE